MNPDENKLYIIEVDDGTNTIRNEMREPDVFRAYPWLWSLPMIVTSISWKSARGNKITLKVKGE